MDTLSGAVELLAGAISYMLGVCAPGGTDPICGADPGTMPKVMDTITPGGVTQATELNPLNGPVQLQGISIP